MVTMNSYRLLLSALILSLAACIGGKSPPSQFYLLEPMRGTASGKPVSAAGSLTAVVLAPVRIPHYADRPQIVTATGKNAYHVAELDRWAEPLEDNVGRVLMQNLGSLIPADVVPANSSGLAKQAKFRVNVQLLEFHVDPQGLAVLAAQWSVARGEEIVVSRRSAYREPASTADYRVMVGALNGCLNRLSREIAGALRPVVMNPANKVTPG